MLHTKEREGKNALKSQGVIKRKPHKRKKKKTNAIRVTVMIFIQWNIFGS